MQKKFLLFVIGFALFVSCKQRNNVHEIPLVNIDSFNSVSKNMLNVDTTVYMNEVSNFLQQRFSPQSELAYILEDNVYVFTDKDIKTVLAKTADLKESDCDSIRLLMLHEPFTQWQFKKQNEYEILSSTTIKTTIQKNGWNYYTNHYGFGFHTFSAPIFFKNYTYCIFYNAFSYGLLSGHGQLCLYQKVNGKWKLVKTYYHWMS